MWGNIVGCMCMRACILKDECNGLDEIWVLCANLSNSVQSLCIWSVLRYESVEFRMNFVSVTATLRSFGLLSCELWNLFPSSINLQMGAASMTMWYIRSHNVGPKSCSERADCPVVPNYVLQLHCVKLLSSIRYQRHGVMWLCVNTTWVPWYQQYNVSRPYSRSVTEFTL